jgi:transcriptional regulator of arginine metabolism
MISKQARQARIREIVRKADISSQEELSEILGREKVEVTQPTLSRDIKELGLIKVRGRYHIPGDLNGNHPVESPRRPFQQYLLRSGISGNMVMLKTAPGNAHALAAALDAMEWPEILGTVAGDDTIFALLRSAISGKAVIKRIEELSS